MTDITNKVGNAISDTAITTKIKAKLAADSIASAFKISVETTEGKVTLTGEVPNQEAVEKAISIAKNTEGVKEIKNNLTIKQ